MKSTILSFVFVLLAALGLQAQSETTQVHRIVFQMQSGDTMAHKALMKQLNNITTVAPDAELEVVCHGPGLQMLLLEKSRVVDKVAALAAKKVKFLACEFSMQEQKVVPAQVLPSAGLVPYGLLEVIGKQEAGWSYIKAGF